MKNLPEARVARLAECHKKQKAGYNQHASFIGNPLPVNANDIDKNGILAQFLIHCQKTTLSEETINTKYKILRVMLNNSVKLNQPDEVQRFIHNRKEWSNGHKNTALYAYVEYCRMKGIQWNPTSIYSKNETLPFVPTEKEIDALINGTSLKVSVALQALKETGFRIGELWRCKWTDIDEEKSTLKCNQPEKKCAPREVRISAKLIGRFNLLPKTNAYVFGKTRISATRTTFDYQRNRLAQKLNNPASHKYIFTLFDIIMPLDYTMRPKVFSKCKHD